MKPMYPITDFQVRCRDLSNSMQNTALYCLDRWHKTSVKAYPYHEDHRIMDRPLTAEEQKIMVRTVRGKIKRAFRLCRWGTRLKVWYFEIEKCPFIAMECEVPGVWIRRLHRSCKAKGHPWGLAKLRMPKKMSDWKWKESARAAAMMR